MQVYSDQLYLNINSFSPPGREANFPSVTDQGVSFDENDSLGSKSVEVSLSSEALRKFGFDQNVKRGVQGGLQADQADQQELKELKETDRKVRAHEQAHLAAGGNLVKGGAHYQYTVGPDGSLYAVGGEVQIDTSPEKDPASSIRKAQRIRTAALAPSDPSAQDRRVAAEASAMEEQARRELAKQKEDTKEGESDRSFDTVSAVGSKGNQRSRHSINRITQAYQSISDTMKNGEKAGVAFSI